MEASHFLLRVWFVSRSRDDTQCHAIRCANIDEQKPKLTPRSWACGGSACPKIRPRLDSGGCRSGQHPEKSGCHRTDKYSFDAACKEATNNCIHCGNKPSPYRCG